MQNTGKPRLKCADRTLPIPKLTFIDEIVGEDHRVRLIWDYVEQLDLSSILNTIKSKEHQAGRPAIDPKILLSLWLYATIEGIASARVLEEFCKEHAAYKWLCGGVSVNHHTLSDFRFRKELEELLIQSVAVLIR